MSINTVLSTPPLTATPKKESTARVFLARTAYDSFGILMLKKKGSPMKTIIVLFACVAISFAIKAINNPTTSSLDDRKNAIERAVANM